jgi:hypothetical protein
MLSKAIKESWKDEKKYATTGFAVAFNIFFILFAITGLPRYDVEVYSMYFLVNSLFYQKGAL